MSWYGEKVTEEREVIAEIIFLRDSRRLSFQKIADELNCRHCMPRWAKKWTWGLTRHQYLQNKPGDKVANA